MNWIIVNTKPCCEEKANTNLKRQGYRVFAPKILKTVSKFNKLKQILNPLFLVIFLLDCHLIKTGQK